MVIISKRLDITDLYRVTPKTPLYACLAIIAGLRLQRARNRGTTYQSHKQHACCDELFWNRFSQAEPASNAPLSVFVSIRYRMNRAWPSTYVKSNTQHDDEIQHHDDDVPRLEAGRLVMNGGLSSVYASHLGARYTVQWREKPQIPAGSLHTSDTFASCSRSHNRRAHWISGVIGRSNEWIWSVTWSACHVIGVERGKQSGKCHGVKFWNGVGLPAPFVCIHGMPFLWQLVSIDCLAYYFRTRKLIRTPCTTSKEKQITQVRSSYLFLHPLTDIWLL